MLCWRVSWLLCVAKERRKAEEKMVVGNSEKQIWERRLRNGQRGWLYEEGRRQEKYACYFRRHAGREGRTAWCRGRRESKEWRKKTKKVLEVRRSQVIPLWQLAEKSTIQGTQTFSQFVVKSGNLWCGKMKLMQSYAKCPFLHHK